MASQPTPRSAALPAVEGIPAAHLQVLGVLVEVEGTVTLPPGSPAGCVRHGRFLRPEGCGTCESLASALDDGRGGEPGGRPRPRGADPPGRRGRRPARTA